MGHDDQCGQAHTDSKRLEADAPDMERDGGRPAVVQNITESIPWTTAGRSRSAAATSGGWPAGGDPQRRTAASLAATGQGIFDMRPRDGHGAIPTAASAPGPWAESAWDGALPWRPRGVKARGVSDGDGNWGLSRRELLVVAAATSGAGATVGDAASEVVGDGNTDVDQAVIIRDVETYASGGGLSVVDSSNTDFVVSVEVTQGERYVLHLLVDNRADEKTNQQFRFDEIPEPLSVELFGDQPTGVDVQATDHTEWAVNIEPEHPTGSPPTSVPDDEQIIEVLVEVANTAAPRTYELNGTLEPTSL